MLQPGVASFDRYLLSAKEIKMTCHGLFTSGPDAAIGVCVQMLDKKCLDIDKSTV